MTERTLIVLAVVGVVAAQRLGELALARHWLAATGGPGAARPESEPVFPFMVALHAGWLVGCAAEPLLWPRPWLAALGWPMAALAVAMAALWLLATALRVWVLATLGRYWHVRIVRRADQPVITAGPYGFIRHPNYLVVIVEIAVVPLLLGAYATALLASLANAVVLAARIRREEAYLLALPAYRSAFGHKARLLPGVW